MENHIVNYLKYRARKAKRIANQYLHGREEVRSNNHMWKVTTTKGQVYYLLAPNLEDAAWRACELSGGTQNLKDVRLSYD